MSKQETIKELQAIVKVGDEVDALINSVTYQTYIQPLIDKMVVDSLGGRTKSGKLVTASEELKHMSFDELKYNIAWGEAIVTLNNMIGKYVEDRDRAIEDIKVINQEPNNTDNTVSDYDMSE